MTVEEGWSGTGKIALQTVGCKLNQAETDSLARKFLDAGYHVVAPTDAPDIYLLNTCTVTHIADHKCRKLLRAAYRRNPSSLIAAVGCYAERAPTELADIDGVSFIIGNHDKDRAVEIVGERINGDTVRREWGKLQNASVRTRAFVKIQEGCSQPCSFCLVPHVRGPERSRPEEEIIAEVKARAAEGYKEVILTGTRIGSYWREGDLRDLIARILAESGIPRLRLSSLEPADLTDDLLSLWKDRRLCEHIHLPLQRGCDSVLARMGRVYSTDEFQQAVSRAREAIPNLALTTDIMVGFPGESCEEFYESYRFCEDVGFADLHVFPYSARPGTKATCTGNTVADTERKRRTGLMLDLASKSSRRFKESCIDHEFYVLWEGKRNNTWFGLTSNYLKVYISSSELLGNELLLTRLIGQNAEGLQGELVNSPKSQVLSGKGVSQ
ncbi:MAG: tRNA (N(6)-L-threonylcarbamoyladenosine(37)-C(2))-methylthiotransferase MtaB [Dehalococcoidia bacterium]|nr:MAG: tRNA (N(6)-L-threonylcarbamoyladenosine(37)-C(2))-methylthiotransferase MtaB [Dehalococcoidia bacterium]